jgi:hypothetical protein
MDLSKVFGAAKSSAKKAKSVVEEAGEGDKDLIESLESDDDLGVIDSGESFGPGMDDQDGDYVRGEDTVADLDRDIEIARQNRKRKMDDDYDLLDWDE